jgi:site-specific DNA-cytosine methylase
MWAGRGWYGMSVSAPTIISQSTSVLLLTRRSFCFATCHIISNRRLIDNDEMAVSTLERNHKEESEVILEDVKILLERVEKEEVGYKGILDAEHGHASPPCQGSSAANTTGSEESKRKENEKTLLFPKAFVLGGWSTGSFENVTGMLRKKNIVYLQDMMHELLFHDIQVRVGSR